MMQQADTPLGKDDIIRAVLFPWLFPTVAALALVLFPIYVHIFVDMGSRFVLSIFGALRPDIAFGEIGKGRFELLLGEMYQALFAPAPLLRSLLVGVSFGGLTAFAYSRLAAATRRQSAETYPLFVQRNARRAKVFTWVFVLIIVGSNLAIFSGRLPSM